MMSELKASYDNQYHESWSEREIGEYTREVSTKNNMNLDIPVLSMTKYDGFVDSLSYFNKQVFSQDVTKYKVVSKGQFAYATIHLDEGSIGLLKEFDKGLISPMYTVFEHDDSVNPEYLLYLLKSDYMISKYNSLGQGSIDRRMSIPYKVFSKIKIKIPPLPEQQKIADILSSVDEAISKTEAIIEQTEKVKKGLMQELLARGIGHTKFKQTEIGEIPEEWEVLTFKEISNEIKSGISRRFSSQDIGYAVIRSNNISNNELILDDIKYWHIIDDQGVDLKSYVLQDNDLLINFINSIAQIGKSCIFREQDRKFIFTTNIFRIRLNKKIVLPEFVDCYTQTNRYKIDIKGITKPAVNQASFTKSDFEKLCIPIPSLSEQLKITKYIRSIDNHIIEEKQKLTKLQTLKKGLMQDLLTGKVRVKLDN